MDRGLTLLFWTSRSMCSKQLLLRNTACKTGLSEHCRISGTAAKIDNEEDVDMPGKFCLHTAQGDEHEKGMLRATVHMRPWGTWSYLASVSAERSDCPPSSDSLAAHWSADGSSWGAGSSSPGSSWSPPGARRDCWSAGGGSSRSGTAGLASGALCSWVQGRSGSTKLAEQRIGHPQREGWWNEGHCSGKEYGQSHLSVRSTLHVYCFHNNPWWKGERTFPPLTTAPWRWTNRRVRSSGICLLSWRVSVNVYSSQRTMSRKTNFHSNTIH